jgi:cob(I)alamin adenosyltransferase
MSPRDKLNTDESYTGLLGRERVPKTDRRIEALGAVDESNAALGLARAQVRSHEAAETILQIQRDLYALMTEIAASPEKAADYRAIDAEKVKWLEKTIQEFDLRVNMPFEFIVPGDSLPGAALDLARTVIRRAERRVVELTHAGDIQNIELVRYLNRASSLCYVMELFEYILAGQDRPTLAKD